MRSLATRFKLETVIFVRRLSIKNTAATLTKGFFERLFTDSWLSVTCGFKSLFEDTFSQKLGANRREGQRKIKQKIILLKLFVGCFKFKLGIYQDVFLILEELLALCKQHYSTFFGEKMQRSISTLVSTEFDMNIPSRNTSSTYAITIHPRENSNKKHQTIIYCLYSLKNLAHRGTPLHTSENARQFWYITTRNFTSFKNQ